MTKSVFDDDFEQRIDNYVLEHLDESKLSIIKRFCIADNTVYKQLKNAGKNNQEICKGSSDFFCFIIRIITTPSYYLLSLHHYFL